MRAPRLHPGSTHDVALVVDGEPVARTVEARLTLADLLRDELGATGTHVGCEEGACGACTVLLDGRAVRSCLVLAVSADGTTVETVASLADGGGDTLHPLQQAFLDHHGLQCGFCTPGMLMTSLALLREQPHPTADEVREGLAGNLCRCTGYDGIVAAVLAAADATTHEKEERDALQ